MATLSFYVGFRIDRKLARGYFISERKETVEAWIADGGKRPQQQKEITEPGAQASKASASPKSEANPFEQLTERFIHSMNQLDRLVPTTLSLLPVAEMIEMNEKLYGPIAKDSASLTREIGFELYKVPLDQFRIVDRAMNEIYILRRGRSNLPGMFLMGLTPAMITGTTNTRDRLGMITLLSTPTATTVAAAVIAIEAR